MYCRNGPENKKDDQNCIIMNITDNYYSHNTWVTGLCDLDKPISNRICRRDIPTYSTSLSPAKGTKHSIAAKVIFTSQ